MCVLGKQFKWRSKWLFISNVIQKINGLDPPLSSAIAITARPSSLLTDDVPNIFQSSRVSKVYFCPFLLLHQGQTPSWAEARFRHHRPRSGSTCPKIGKPHSCVHIPLHGNTMVVKNPEIAAWTSRVLPPWEQLGENRATNAATSTLLNDTTRQHPNAIKIGRYTYAPTLSLKIQSEDVHELPIFWSQSCC